MRTIRTGLRAWKRTAPVINVEYERDPAAIYRQSFEMIRAETRLELLPEELHPVAIRMIHTCGMIDLVEDLAASLGAVEAGQNALQSGAAILTDVEMVKSGIIKRFLPAGNPVRCTLNEPQVRSHAQAIGNTRSAAAVDFWDEFLEGAIVAIGNAPTALFRLLELVLGDGPKPALIIGMPVGFVGAVESKQALSELDHGCAYITVHGRRGGSALAASAVNAVAAGLEGAR